MISFAVSVCSCAAQTNTSMVAVYKQSQVTMQPGSSVIMNARDALCETPGQGSCCVTWHYVQWLATQLTERLVGSTTIRHQIVRKKNNSAPASIMCKPQKKPVIPITRYVTQDTRNKMSRLRSSVRYSSLDSCAEHLPNIITLRYMAASIPDSSMTSSCVYL